MNRFSIDINIIDDALPKSAFNFLQVFAFVCASFVFAAYLNFFMLIPTVTLAYVFYKFRNDFMRTSRTLKRLEAECK
jgi:hypothetical protein